MPSVPTGHLGQGTGLRTLLEVGNPMALKPGKGASWDDGITDVFIVLRVVGV